MDGEPQGAIRERGKKLEARMKGEREGDEARCTEAQNSTHPLHLHHQDIHTLTWEHSGQCVNTNLSMCCVQWSLSREA